MRLQKLMLWVELGGHAKPPLWLLWLLSAVGAPGSLSSNRGYAYLATLFNPAITIPSCHMISFKPTNQFNPH